MPAVAAIGVAIGTAASTAGAAAMTALGGLTLTGLATGATIVGAGMQLVGAATGSKTISKIGMGFSIAGGVGMAAGGLSSMSALSSAGGAVKGAASVTGSTSKSSGLLAADTVDDALAARNKSRATSEGFKTFGGSNAMSNSADSFKNSAAKIGDNPGSLNAGTQAFDPELEKSYFQRASQTLTQYNPMMNMLGGMGEAYMMNERMQLEKGLAEKRIGIDQQALDLNKQKQDFLIKNNSTPMNINPSLNLQRDTGAYTGLLRG